MEKQSSNQLVISANSSTEEYHATITCLRAQVDQVKKQLNIQKECADVANFGKQQLLIVNKTLIAKLNFAREQKLPKNQAAKVSPVSFILQAILSLSIYLSFLPLPSYRLLSLLPFVCDFLCYFP